MSIGQIWDRLRHVGSLRFTATSTTASGWNGRGEGTVAVEVLGDTVLLFHESGVWWPDGGHALRFQNVYRWTRLDSGLLRLEHLRFGADHAVHLFDLTQAANGVWEPATPHLCREDCYSASMRVEESNLYLCWSINGPRKHETIEYTYW